jgi:hypothetical protein
VQVVCEPAWVYDEAHAWCATHKLMGLSHPPAVRMDTALTKFEEHPRLYGHPSRGAGGVGEGDTAFLWAPYGGGGTT